MIGRFLLLCMLIAYLNHHVFGHMESRYTLSGKHNSEEFTLLIQNFDGEYFARYYKHSDLKDRMLEGNCDSTSCVFVDGYWSDKGFVKTDSIAIEQVKKHKWKGTWTTIDVNKTTKLKLVPVVDTLPVPSKLNIEGNSIYTINKLSRLTFGKAHNSGKSFQKIIEEHTQIECLRTNSNSKLDSVLLNLYYRVIDKSLSCAAIGAKVDFEFSSLYHYLSDSLLSIEFHLKSNCDGTSHQTQQEYLTFNVKGERLRLDQIVPFAGEELAYQSQKWYSYRNSIFPEQLVPLLKSQNQEAFFPTDNSCDLNNTRLWQIPDWYISSKGIVLMPFFGVNINNCTATKVYLNLK